MNSRNSSRLSYDVFRSFSVALRPHTPDGLLWPQSPGRPPRLSHTSRALMTSLIIWGLMSSVWQVRNTFCHMTSRGIRVGEHVLFFSGSFLFCILLFLIKGRNCFRLICTPRLYVYAHVDMPNDEEEEEERNGLPTGHSNAKT